MNGHRAGRSPTARPWLYLRNHSDYAVVIVGQQGQADGE